MLICQWFYAIPVALPFEAQNFSPSMKIGTYKKKTLKIDHQVLKKSLNDQFRHAVHACQNRRSALWKEDPAGNMWASSNAS